MPFLKNFISRRRLTEENVCSFRRVSQLEIFLFFYIFSIDFPQKYFIPKTSPFRMQRSMFLPACVAQLGIFHFKENRKRSARPNCLSSRKITVVYRNAMNNQRD